MEAGHCGIGRGHQLGRGSPDEKGGSALLQGRGQFKGTNRHTNENVSHFTFSSSFNVQF